MLEEALRNEKHNPAETALAMLSFIQMELPAGGAAAETRFFRLYGLLCERIYGSISDHKDGFRHKDGGWLSMQNPWSRQPASAPRPLQTIGSPGQSSSGSTSLESDPVVKLLGTAGKPASKDLQPPTLIEAISRATENRSGVSFPFPFEGLPKPFQDAWMALLNEAFGGKPTGTHFTENSQRLVVGLIRKRPEDQNDLILYQQRKARKLEQRQPLQISPRGFNIPPSPKQSNDPSKPNQDAPPNVMLSMMEYYLVLSLRYPLSARPAKSPPVTASRPMPSRQVVRKREAYGDIVYFHVLRRMLRHFLPYEREEARFIGFDTTTPESELFLRLAIAMWIEPQSTLSPTASIVAEMEERRRRAGITDLLSLDLKDSYDIAPLKYDPPTLMVRKCCRSLIIHVVLDPDIPKTVLDKETAHNRWCLPSAMTTLQQPFFNYVRATFRHTSLHNPESPFFSALNAWLIWLEPWNLTTSKKQNFSPKNATQRLMGSVSGERKDVTRALTIPRYNQASKYSPAWEPYVAANIHLYTVPLAIFLRRARELDFSSRKFDRSIEIVKRVFRVFTPELVAALSRRAFAHLEEHHMKVLGPFAPPLKVMSLSSCQNDMTNILEEIQMQHLKKVGELDIFDRMVSSMEGIFGRGVVSGEEKTLESLVERARLIASLPLDYEIRNAARPSVPAGETAVHEMAPARGKDGLLTDVGRAQLVAGTARCRPEDVQYVGDKMRSRPGTYEIPVFVELSIASSDWLNKKCGLVAGSGKGDLGLRFNLRFLADYRNLLFVSVFTYIVLTMLRLTLW